MTSGSLTDLDPPAARERRWPFYVVWMMGGLVVGAVLLTHLPAALAHPSAPKVGDAIATEAPPPTVGPAAPRIVNPLPPASPLRVAPVPLAPARP